MNTGIVTTTDITITLLQEWNNPSITVTGMNIRRPNTHTNTGLTPNIGMNTIKSSDFGLWID